MAWITGIAILLLAGSLLSAHAIRVLQEETTSDSSRISPRWLRWGHFHDHCPYNDPRFDEPFHSPCWRRRPRVPIPDSQTSAAPSTNAQPVVSSDFDSNKMFDQSLWESLPDPFFDEPYNPPVDDGSASSPSSSPSASSDSDSSKMLWWPWRNTNLPDPFFDEPYNPSVEGSAESPAASSTTSSVSGSNKMLWWPWRNANLPDPIFDEPYNPPVKGQHASSKTE